MLACVPAACGGPCSPLPRRPEGGYRAFPPAVTPAVGGQFLPARRAAVNSKCPFKHPTQKQPLSGSRYGLSDQSFARSGELPGVSSAGPLNKGLSRLPSRLNTHSQNTLHIRAAYPGHRILRGGPNPYLFASSGVPRARARETGNHFYRSLKRPGFAAPRPRRRLSIGPKSRYR